MYALGSFIGFFAIMLALMGIAIAIAKHGICWLFYGAGGVLQFLSLLGHTKTMNQWGWLMGGTSYKTGIILRWVVYILIMVVSFVIIQKKRRDYLEEEFYKNTATQSSSKSSNQTQSSTSRMEPKANASAAASATGWQCECGRTNADYIMTCACGITKKEMKLRNLKGEKAE